MQAAEKSKIGDVLRVKLEPLTRKQSNGEPVRRPPEVEAAIQEILEIDLQFFFERLKTSNAENSKIKVEVLVFLLRAALAAGNGELADEISQALYDRVEIQIESYARRLVPKKYFEEAARDMTGDLFMKICDLNSNASDFAQARFGLYLKRLCGERWRKYQAQGKLDDQSILLDEPDSETGKSREIEAAPNKFSSADWEDVKKGLAILPEPLRTAFILRYGEGLQVESIKANEMTLSRYFGKTERTIRNWLTRAEDLLATWRKEQSL